MAAYWIAHVEVTDPDAYAEYAKRATIAIEAHGGELLARGTRTVWLEGKERARCRSEQRTGLRGAARLETRTHIGLVGGNRGNQASWTVRPPTTVRTTWISLIRSGSTS